MKFDELVSVQLSRLNEAPEQDVQPNDPAAASKLPPSPTSADAAAKEQDVINPEGKVFLVDLVRKALAFDPHQLPEFDREVLGANVTIENADKVLKDIQRILGTN